MNAYRFAKSSILFSLIILISFSCKKDLNLVGLDLVSPEELLKLGYTDTVQVNAFSVREDSVKTANLAYPLLGSMNDPIFGVSTADWFSQIRLTSEPTDFGTNPVFDSAFLYLPFVGSYGDTLSNMTLRVYHLNESIFDSIHKYSINTISYDQANPLGELTFSPRPHDSAYFEGQKHAPVLRIPLNSNFGQLIIGVDTANFTNNTKFLSYFKGIAIVSESQSTPGKGAIIKMAVAAGSSKISMFYHNSTDTSGYNFTLSSDCKSFTHFDHGDYDEASPLLRQQILTGDTTLGGQFLFVQTMGGVRVKLRIPGVKNWFSNQKVIINDAQLILTNASPSSTFPPPSNISLYPVAADGTLSAVSLPDANEGQSYFGGYYNSSSGRYTFRLTHYIQQLMTGEQNDYGLYLIIPGSSISGGRLVLNGIHAPSSSMKLYIKYTVIN